MKQVVLHLYLWNNKEPLKSEPRWDTLILLSTLTKVAQARFTPFVLTFHNKSRKCFALSLHHAPFKAFKQRQMRYSAHREQAIIILKATKTPLEGILTSIQGYCLSHSLYEVKGNIKHVNDTVQSSSVFNSGFEPFSIYTGKESQSINHRCLQGWGRGRGGRAQTESWHLSMEMGINPVLVNMLAAKGITGPVLSSPSFQNPPFSSMQTRAIHLNNSHYTCLIHLFSLWEAITRCLLVMYDRGANPPWCLQGCIRTHSCYCEASW